MKKNNKILKYICYVLIPIVFAALVMSITYIFYRENNLNKKLDANNFTYVYMNKLSNSARSLIYNKEISYSKVKDNDTTIFYENNNYNNSPKTIKDLQYLIIYKNLAYTNVELTTDTNTIQKISNYINSQDTKKTNIINGNIESDTENISKKAIQYFNEFDFGYYKDEDENLDNVNEIYTKNSDTSIASEHFVTNIKDFKIYTSYSENVLENAFIAQVSVIGNKLENFNVIVYIMLPINTLLLIWLVVYLVINIGIVNGKKEVELNAFDRTPLEIFITVSGIILLIFLSLLSYSNTTDYDSVMDIKFLSSIFITVYMVSYIVFATLSTTIIKRLKAKKFWKTTFIGLMYNWFTRKINNINSNIKNVTSRKQKLILFVTIVMVLEIIFGICFNKIGIFIDFLITVLIVYKFSKYVASYDKIEKKLEEMYTGNNKEHLNELDVEPDFRKSVKYINNISNGFENAIQESIKSERMKTELITNVSHDIKTPLTSIINYVDLLKEVKINNKKANEYIEILDNKSQRLKKLIEDLVEASKASTGSIKFNIETINIVELMKQSIGEFEDKFNKIGLEIIPAYSNNEIAIEADNRYMYRIIENLFSNISKYALNNSRVYIDIYEKNDKVIIDMKNISKEKLNISEEELMQRFVRGDKSRNTEGSGLGISIAKSLVELQNGNFNLEIDGDLFKVKIEFNK